MFSSPDFFAGGPLYSGPPHLNATGRAPCAAATCPGAPWSDLVKRTPWNSMEFHGIPLCFHQFSSPRGRFRYILIIFSSIARGRAASTFTLWYSFWMRENLLIKFRAIDSHWYTGEKCVGRPFT